VLLIITYVVIHLEDLNNNFPYHILVISRAERLTGTYVYLSF